MHIVLHQPEIPANTGNIGRTCVATGTSLHLIEPLGFRLDEKSIKRAGMDYWEHLDVTRYMNYQEFTEKHTGAKVWLATTKAKRSYTEVSFGPDDFIMFVDESHITLPQVRGMYNGDRARKSALVDYGFRLPSAYDNRPLNFDEFNDRIKQVIYCSDTPN